MKLKLHKKRNGVKKKSLNFTFKEIKIFCAYLVNHPDALIKAFFYFFKYGPNKFINKLILIEKKQKKFKKIKSTTYYRLLEIKYWLKKILFSPINFAKLFFLKIVPLIYFLTTNFFKILFLIIFPLIYFLITILFFTVFKLFEFIFSTFRVKLEVNKDKTALNGISFIIPTWNKKDMVIDCVKNLDNISSSENKNIPKEIIVIDNGSIDGTYEELMKLKTKTSLTSVRSEKNLGFARGINLGASKAKYNYIYLMNNDMVPKPNLIIEIVKFAQNLLDNNKPFFGLSSQIFFFDPKKRREESGKNYYRSDFGYLYVAHCVNDNNLTAPSITGYPGGGSSFINKDLFLKLCGYDKDLYLPLYDEDMDLGFIAWKLGFPSYFVPNSQIIHHHRSSSKKLAMDPNYYMFKNWVTFVLKNYDSWSLFLTHIFLFPFRMLSDQRFVTYAWENTKIIHKILYKKIMLSKYKRVYNDTELINFPKFEFNFYNNEK